MTNKPLILDIKANSLDDGAGIRSVVFFKGCPLSCVWCHNPESRKASPEIAFDSEKCIDCGSCRDLCPEKALSKRMLFMLTEKPASSVSNAQIPVLRLHLRWSESP